MIDILEEILALIQLILFLFLGTCVLCLIVKVLHMIKIKNYTTIMIKEILNLIHNIMFIIIGSIVLLISNRMLYEVEGYAWGLGLMMNILFLTLIATESIRILINVRDIIIYSGLYDSFKRDLK